MFELWIASDEGNIEHVQHLVQSIVDIDLDYVNEIWV